MRDKSLSPTVLLGVILCFAFAFQAVAQKAEIEGWDKFKWGMSPEEVKQVYFDYENISGEKIWEEEKRTDRFCMLKTNSFYILESYFSPEITLSFFDNKLFKIEICQEISHRAIGLLAYQIEKLSALADRLIKKYGTPAGGGSPTWQEDGKRILDILDEFWSFLQRKERDDALSWLRATNGFTLSWQEEGEDELDFDVWYWVGLDDQDSLGRPQCHIELIMRYVNTSLRDKYEQERRKVRDEIKIEFESF